MPTHKLWMHVIVFLSCQTTLYIHCPASYSRFSLAKVHQRSQNIKRNKGHFRP